MIRRRTLLACAAAVAGGLGLNVAHAQDDTWPRKQPIKIIVPFAAGGTSDALARLLGERLQEALKQTVIVENRGGAGGMIGSDAAAKSPPDGYTIVLGTISSHAIIPAVQKKVPYDAVKDFVPVFFIGNVPNVMLVNAQQPIHSVKELIAAAKAKPGSLSFGTAGAGSSQHLSGEKFKLDAGVDITHVPYRGSGPSMQDLIAGQIPMSFDTALVALPQIKTGRIRALAVTSGKRAKALPDVPTLAESGLRGFDVSSWQAFFAPAGTPQPIITRLHEELAKMAGQTATAARLQAMGVEYAPMTPAQLGAFQKAEIVKWEKVAKDAKLEL
ncbi:tripartite tricarboxylate transporter substrate binding protein [Rhizobacter sp. Root1221]|uniref:Bug family tripartite tricarboxylate transporter substrate binding protein n=1 Tax=Rhizobacter sp. Root1221 TaxID=1736433 RepID=UPI000A84690E|nr:tripartite tricarboxylate transporter substrate binding protein [Rhizobacter sp. Root1221]